MSVSFLGGQPPLPLNTNRWSELVRQLGVVKGDMIVSEVGRQLLPVLVVESDRPEHKYLASERLGMGQILKAAAGAGVTGFAGLRNPLGSGIIVVLEYATALPQSISQFFRVYGSLVRGATLTQANTEQPRDTRWQPTGAFGVGAPNIAGQVVSGQSDTIAVVPFVVAEIVGGLGQNATLAGAYLAEWKMPIVLAPGDTFVFHPSDGVGGNQANLAIQGSFFWRERSLEPTET